MIACNQLSPSLKFFLDLREGTIDETTQMLPPRELLS